MVMKATPIPITSLAHASLTAVTSDQHHAESHTHDVVAASADVDVTQSTTSTTYTDLATSGPAVTLSPGSATTQVISVSGGNVECTGTLAYASVAVAGAAAVDNNAGGQFEVTDNITAGPRLLLETAVADASTHTMKYRRHDAGTGTFAQQAQGGRIGRRIIAFCLTDIPIT